MKRLSPWLKSYMALWLCLFVLGVALRIRNLDGSAFVFPAIALILTFGVVLMLGEMTSRSGSGRGLLSVLGAASIAALAQTFGSNHELVFANRDLNVGNWLSLSIAGIGIPLVAILLAAVIIIGSYDVARCAVKPFFVPFMAAAIATLVEIPIEPVASEALRCWHWTYRGPIMGAPWSNLGSWFIMSLLGTFWIQLYAGREVPRSSNAAAVLYSSVLGLLAYGALGLEKSILFFMPVFLLLLWDNLCKHRQQ